MESQTTTQFQSGSLVPPPNLDGPDVGLVSADEDDGLGNGVEAIKDSVTITVSLSGSYFGNLIDFIEANWVALTFGSSGDRTSVPDASTTVMLLGIGSMALEGLRRKFVKS